MTLARLYTMTKRVTTKQSPYARPRESRNGNPLPPALVLGLKRAVGLDIVRELGMHGVPVIGVGESNALACSSRYLTAFAERPAGPVAEWLPRLIAKTGAGGVFAFAEGDLRALAAMPEQVGNCRILTPRAGPLEKVLDKTQTLGAAAALGIQTPRSWQPRAAGEAPPDLGWPVVLKWADSVAAAPVIEAAGLEMEKAEYCRDSAGLRAALARYDGIGMWPLVQEHCPGRGLAHMFHMEKGAATLRFQHERIHEWPPEGGVSTLCRGLPAGAHAAQMAKSEALLASIGWEGPAMVEYRWDPRTDRCVLMEVNGRFWGSQPLATWSGAHFVWELYRRGVLSEKHPPPPPREGLRARQLVEETKRLWRVLAGRIKDPTYRRTPLRDATRYLAGFLDPNTRGFVFAWCDPGPGLAEVRHQLGKLVHRRR